MIKSGDKIEDLFSPKKKSITLYSVFFVPGTWKHLFSEQETRIMIAEALNYSIHSRHMQLAGYLLGKKKCCLVLKNNKADTDWLLMVFYGRLRREIRKAYTRLNLPGIRDRDMTLAGDALLSPLPTSRDVMNDYLVRLLTGRPVDLPYDDIQLIKLKKQVSSSAFCSAPDYSGAKGPILLTLIGHRPGMIISDIQLENNMINKR